jgi:hypothetical protein
MPYTCTVAPQYNQNIVESGVKQHQANKQKPIVQFNII